MTTESKANDNHPLGGQITRDYKILRLLGKGGMGEVYLAEQLRVGRRRVALKVLNHTFASNPDMAQRFENEASSAGRINHRNVVTVYESRITDDGQMYVAMEFVEGKSLTEFLNEKSALPLDRVVEITRQMCAGLAAAHKLGIIHRDIKPDNIMLAEEDGAQVVKLLDFGIARLSETDPSIGKTRAGVIMGTPTYMSPEQAMGKTGDKIDARSDIYSLGVVIHQMISGHVVFKASSPLEIIRKHISEQPLSLKHWRPDLQIPDAVEEVVMKALQKNRELRQQSVTELASELEAAALGIRPVAPVSQKDMPTVRISKDAPTTATAPLSSEKTSAGQLPDGNLTAYPLHSGIGIKTAGGNQEPTSPQMARQTAQRAKNPPKPAPQPTPHPLEAAPPTVPIEAAVALVEGRQNPQPEPRQRQGREDDQRITSREPRSYKKELLIASLVLLAMVAVLFAVLRQRSAGSVTPLLEFRLMRDEPLDTLDTLALDNTVHTGKSFYFDLKPIHKGSFYVFAEQGGRNNGWQWLNPADQDLEVGIRARAPFGNSVHTEKPAGEKSYLLVIVPEGINWAPAAALAAALMPGDGKVAEIVPKNNIAELPSAIASQIQTSLKQAAVELNASGSQQGRAVSFLLSNRGDPRQVAFYRVKVNQLP
jgi:serine/threonine protein kinase